MSACEVSEENPTVQSPAGTLRDGSSLDLEDVVNHLALRDTSLCRVDALDRACTQAETHGRGRGIAVAIAQGQGTQRFGRTERCVHAGLHHVFSG